MVEFALYFGSCFTLLIVLEVAFFGLVYVRRSRGMKQGRRLESVPRAGLCGPGEYYKAADGWRGRTPNGLAVWLRSYTVDEHADGTITVTPQILTSDGMGEKVWHGYLERGVWREI